MKTKLVLFCLLCASLLISPVSVQAQLSVVQVTFQVDMSAQVLVKKFNPAVDFVSLSGSFNSWQGAGGWTGGFILTNTPTGSNTNLYTGTTAITNSIGYTNYYKFLVDGGTNLSLGNSGWELPVSTGGGNRSFLQNATNSAQTLPAVFFSDLGPSDFVLTNTLVTFTVNMAGAIGDEGHVFNPSSDSVYINGDFLGWWAWGTNPASDLMTNIPGTTNYTITKLIPFGNPLLLDYDYGINGVADEVGYGTNNLRYIRASGNFVMPLDMFNYLVFESPLVWTNPAPIAYGTPLGTNQLNASCAEPGTLTYYPPSGTVVAAGANTLKVVFTPTDTNHYSLLTNTVTLTVLAFPPSITLQPSPQVVPAGTPATMSVTATGSPSLYYQWMDSLGPIPGANNSSYLLNLAQTNNWDNYFVIVTNAFGAATSTVTPLIVYGPVTIDAQPLSQVVPLGATTTLTVLASGYPAPAYQWTFNGTNLVGATSNTLTITNVNLPNTGNYQVLINNGYSTNDSYVSTLNVSPSFTSMFSGVTAIWGKSAALSVEAVGSGTLNYQWYLNGVAIAGANGDILNFTSIQFTNAGLYSVVVSSPYGSITNAPYQVVVNPANVSLGFSPTLTIGGVAGYSYIIQSSTNLGNTNAWITLTNLTLTQPVQLWVDTNVDASSPFNLKTFYKVLPGQ